MLTPIQQHFRDAMAKLAAGVNILTTNGQAGKCGLTATAVCSVTDSPPTLMACINRESQMNAVFKKNKRLCVNILHANQVDLAQHFAGFRESCMDERFEWDIWHTPTDPHSPPCLKEALANLSGNVVEVQEIGTHSVFLVELDQIQINAFEAENAPSLVYFAREFHQVG
ncbi:4-hydroxyphenylacetate 3-monooxygenase, reductase component [Pasteurella sp. PK-2025]|uniref:4-hydroxyphenylacetate 3-monooxygenase, reductase component n=1 Tax=Pasteurella sp. PK-2025 TaxID=3413133 RepID=UPI003C74DE0F